MDARRAVQLVARVITLALVGKAGFDAAGAEAIGGATGELVIAAVFAAVDLFLLHRKPDAPSPGAAPPRDRRSGGFLAISERGLAWLVCGVVLILLVAVLSSTGCATVVKPSDVIFFDASAANARVFNAKVQAIEDPTPQDWADTKRWVDAQAGKAAYLADWAHGRDPEASGATVTVTSP